MESWCPLEYRVSVLQDEKSLGDWLHNSVCGCTYYQTVDLKMVEMVNFMLYIYFATIKNFKKEKKICYFSHKKSYSDGSFKHRSVEVKNDTQERTAHDSGSYQIRKLCLW